MTNSNGDPLVAVRYQAVVMFLLLSTFTIIYLWMVGHRDSD